MAYERRFEAFLNGFDIYENQVDGYLECLLFAI